MKESTYQISESLLSKQICNLKDKKDYRTLASYLIGALAAGHVPLSLQSKIYNELGFAHLQLDEPLEAEKAFLSAVERNPLAVNPRFNRANLAMYAQKFTRAFGLFQEVLEIDSSHVGATFHSGLCLFMADHSVEALPYFESSAKAAPDAMGPNFWAGEALVAQKRFAEALPYFLKAAEITPDHRESQRGIAICRFELGEYDACVEQCNTLILSGGGSEFLAFQVKGDALIEMGEIEAAAFCHLELAEMDFDARDFLVMRAKELARQYPHHVSRYVDVILDAIPGLERALEDLANSGAGEVAHKHITVEEISHV